MHCTYCNRKGHTEEYCYKKIADEKNKNTAANVTAATSQSFTFTVQPNSEIKPAVSLTVYDNCLHLDTQEQVVTSTDSNKPIMFIGDTGATMHMVCTLRGMIDLIPMEIPIKVGNKETMKSKYRGTFIGEVIQKNGDKLEIKLNNVLYVPELWINLISVTKVSETSPDSTIKIKQGVMTFEFPEGRTIVFDHKLKSEHGFLLGVNVQPYGEKAMVTSTSIELKNIHQSLGHPNLNNTISTAKSLG
jgi:hypothetical protein